MEHEADRVRAGRNCRQRILDVRDPADFDPYLRT
jgi:hypothetical protein